MTLTRTGLAKIVVATILFVEYFVGYGLLVRVDWRIAAGVFLCIWGDNACRRIESHPYFNTKDKQ